MIADTSSNADDSYTRHDSSIKSEDEMSPLVMAQIITPTSFYLLHLTMTVTIVSIEVLIITGKHIEK